MMTDLLCEQTMDPETSRTFLQQIREQMERMQWLVSSLLKLAKLDAGAVVFMREPQAVFPLIHQAVAPLLVMMEGKELSLDISGQDDVRIMADRRWTVEALTNIIKNCIEHTRQGGLQITAVQTNLYTQIQDVYKRQGDDTAGASLWLRLPSRSPGGPPVSGESWTYGVDSPVQSRSSHLRRSRREHGDGDWRRDCLLYTSRCV